jgi:glycosyltransferase involved in cell wall biosynthesis
LLRIIEDDDLRLKLAKNGRSISLENYNYTKLVFNIESLYQKII